MTTWADIQRLASDLQRVQLAQSAKKLSDINCVEVVGKLIERALIDVVFTRDGHSYITKKHLEREIENECIAAGGRCSLVDISSHLNVDFDHIERTARLLSQSSNGLILSSGEVFAGEYVDHLKSELRRLLAEDGARSFSNLCKHWTLSQELLQSLLLDHLTPSEGLMEGEMIYTHQYLQQKTNLLRAILTAVTKTTTIQSIQKRISLTPKRFWSSFDALVDAGEVTGRLNGSRTSPSCSYVPYIHDQLVKQYINSILRENEYIELSSLRKLGVADSNVKNLFNMDIILYTLPTVVITDNVYINISSQSNACVDRKGWCELNTELDTNIPLEDEDFEWIGQSICSNKKEYELWTGFLYSVAYIKRIVDGLAEYIQIEANEEVDRMSAEAKKPTQTKKVEAEDDWGDGKKKNKKGGGAAKGVKGKKDGNELDHGRTVTLDSEKVKIWIQKRYEGEVPSRLVDHIVEIIITEVRSRLSSAISILMSTQHTLSAQNEKKSLVVLSERVRSIYNLFCTYETASTGFVDPLGNDLRQFLLKSVGNDMANVILAYATGNEAVAGLKEKQRDETIQSLAPHIRDAINAVYSSLKSSDLQAFHDALFIVSSPSICSLSLRTPDKATRSAVCEDLIKNLSAALQEEKDEASCLVTAVLLILSTVSIPTIASGKFVVALIEYLAQIIPQTTHNLLVSCQKGVVHCLKNKSDDVAKEMLAADMQNLKHILLSKN